MKILIATGLYPPDIGGPATYSKTLFEELPKHGIGVEIVSFGLVRRLPRIIRHLVYFLKVLRLGRKSDIIFAQDPVSVGLPTVLAAKILGKKFILKIVGDYAWEQCDNKISDKKFITPEEFQDKKFDIITETRRKIERWVAKQADKIIVPSQYLKKIVGMWGIPESKIRVIYNAVKDVKTSMRMGDQSIQNIEKDCILSVGRLTPWKGFGILIEVMAELPDDIKLIIIGGGPEKNNLEAKISDLGLEERVNLLDQMPREELMDCLRQARIFVLNSGYEGLSHMILEAMQSGVPVIASRIGGNPESIEDGQNGILFEYNNKQQIKEAILRLWCGIDLQNKFIANSFEKIKILNLEQMLFETIQTLKEVC